MKEKDKVEGNSTKPATHEIATQPHRPLGGG